VRAGTVALSFVILSAVLFYFLVWSDQKPRLDQSAAQELELRETFRAKHSKAVNLAVYQQQLADIERSFGALLRQLPGKTEVPNLLVDISQVGVGAGLEEKLFQPSAEVKKDFYAELPIKIKLTGSYHQMGEFISGIAALPRIVTLHEITIKPENKDMYDNLSFELTAKTFRYLDDAEVAAAEKSKAPAAPPPAG
jgi:type IV pilus assembly protein PilO